MALTTTQQTQLQHIFLGMFDMPAGGWLTVADEVITAGMTVDEIAEVLTTTPAYLYADSTDFGADLLDGLMGTTVAAADKAPLATAINDLITGGWTQAQVITELTGLLADPALVDDATWGAAAQQFQNQVTVAEYYTDQGGTATDVAELQAFVDGVTDDAATVTAAQAEVDSALVSFTLTASADSINEGEANTFTVTASQPVAADTDVTFQLKIDAAGDTAQLADFNAGSFNPQTVTILAGETTATFDMTSITNDGTELSEKYTVEATVAGETLSKQVTILDGSVGAGQTFQLTTGLDIIPGMTGSNGNTVTSGNDTIIGVVDTATPANSTLNATDLINAGEGTDTLQIVASGALATGQVPSVSNVETFNVQGSAAVALDTTSQVGLANLNITKAGGAINADASATTDVDVTMAAAGAAVVVDGGNNVNVALTGIAAAADVVTVGGATAAAGDVTVTTAGAALTSTTAGHTLSAINVTGGSTITVNQSATSSDAAAASDTTNITLVEGDVAIVGDASTTEVSVTQDQTVTAANASYKTGGVTETASVKFSALTAGQTLIMGGLTFTAPAALTAEEAAASFANLINGTLPAAGDSQGSGPASDGTYTGIMSGWTSSAVVGDTVVFTSTAANSNPADLANTGTGTVVVTTTDGKAHDAGAAGGVMGVTAGAVTVNDVNGTIKTITLDGFGAASSTTATSVLETLNLSNANDKNTASALTVADTASTLALNVDGLGASTLDAGLTLTAAPTTLNVVSTGTNYVNLAAAATETLNVSGTGLFDVDATDLAALKTVAVTGTAGLKLNGGESNTLTSVTTTGTTGTVTATIDGSAATYTGGAGVDNVTVATTAALTKAIDLGAGDDTLTFGALAVSGSTATLSGGADTDTLSMTTTVADGLDGAAQSFYTNFERLTLSDVYGTDDAVADSLTLDLANLGFTDYVTTSGTVFGTVLNAGTNDTLVLNKMASGGTVALTAAGLVTVQVADAATGTADVLNVDMTSAAALTAGTLTAADVETINIVAEDTNSTAHVDTLTLTADKATSVNISGDAGLTLTMTGSTKVTSIDASTMTGDLTVASLNTTTATTITGGDGDDVLTAATGTTADILIGGAGDDTLNANAGLGTLTGGEGNDLFVVGTASLNSSSYSTITDFAAGDLIEFTGADSFAASQVTQADTAVFQDYANAAMNAIGVNDVAWFQYANNTYVVMDAGADSTTFTNSEDFVVRLSGLVDLTDATFNDTYDTIAMA